MPRLYKPGSFLRIPLADGSFGYGRVLKLPHDAYYNYRTETPDSDLDRIASQPILFKISVRHLEERGWELIGWRKLEEQFSQPIVQFMQNRGELPRLPDFRYRWSLREVRNRKNASGSNAPLFGKSRGSRNACSTPSWDGPTTPWSAIRSA